MRKIVNITIAILAFIVINACCYICGEKTTKKLADWLGFGEE